MLSVHSPRAEPSFLIESDAPLTGALWPQGAQQARIGDWQLAVAIAAKSRAPAGSEVRVVYLPTGEVVYRKQASAL